MTNYPTYVTPATATHCLAPGCRQHNTTTTALAEVGETLPTPRVVVRGTELCEWHHRQFGRVLLDLVTLWSELEQARVRRPAQAKNDRVQSSSVDAGVFWNPHVAQVLYELTDWVGFLTRTILTQMPLPAPEVIEWPRVEVYHDVLGQRHERHYIVTETLERSHGLTQDDPPRIALAAVARWHHRWLSEYPGLGVSLLADALTHRRVAIAALDTSPVRRLIVRGHTCMQEISELDFGGTLLCAAPLFAILRDPSDTKPSAILCSANPGHPQLPQERWMEYAHGR